MTCGVRTLVVLIFCPQLPEVGEVKLGCGDVTPWDRLLAVRDGRGGLFENDTVVKEWARLGPKFYLC